MGTVTTFEQAKQLVYKFSNWKAGSAQAIGETLHRMLDHHGSITPRMIVDEARAESSPLHVCFEWDDSIAAEKFRLDQAREVVAAIRVVTIGPANDETLMRLVVNVQDVDEHDRAYVTTVRALSDEELFLRTKQQFLRDANAMRDRYRDFVALRVLAEDVIAKAEEIRFDNLKKSA